MQDAGNPTQRIPGVALHVKPKESDATRHLQRGGKSVALEEQLIVASVSKRKVGRLHCVLPFLCSALYGSLQELVDEGLVGLSLTRCQPSKTGK